MTMAIRILAISENWNCMPAIETQRDDPPTPLPMASVTTSRPRLTK